MRILDFLGVVPKVHRRKLQAPYAQRAINIDVYGGKLQGLPSPMNVGHVLDVYGNTMTGDIATLHIAGDVVVGFKHHTFVAPDPQKRMGEHSFLFVDGGVLWRTSPAQILKHCLPTKVGIQHPCAAPKLAKLPAQGCKAEVPPDMCAPRDTKTCDSDIPPIMVSYKFTYVNQCAEESAPSPAATSIDITPGDAVALHDSNTAPENAVARRWYRSMVGSKGEVVWLFVAETAIDNAGFIDAKCTMELGEELSTNEHYQPPECIRGVAAFGDNTTVLWTDKQLYVSEPMLPNAYKERNIQRLRYNIVGAVGYVDNVEGEHTYKLAVLTDGLPYSIIGHTSSNMTVREVQDWQPCVSARSITVGEGLVYYASEHGVVAFSGGNAKVITADYFTEIEWKDLLPSTQALCFWGGRLWGFHKYGGFYIRTSNSDVDRVECFVELSDTYDACAATPDRGMYVAGSNEPVQLYKWCASDNQRLRYTWRTRVETQAGLWCPVSLKVEAERGMRCAVSHKARQAWKVWNVTNGTCLNTFMKHYPEYRAFYADLSRTQEAVNVSIYADDELYYERTVQHNRPMRIPRIRRALHWDIEISGSIPVIELHMQTSNEDLTQEGGAV